MSTSGTTRQAGNMADESTQLGENHLADQSSIPTETETTIDWSKAQQGARLLLEAFGENPDRNGLKETWERRVPSAIETLSEGYQREEKPTMRAFENGGDNFVMKTGIPIHSLCEHHLLPYSGMAHLAYRPNGKVVGLSKLIRYVQWKSRRLTVQERLTQEVADGLAHELDTGTVMVELRATHMCEVMRGIETKTATTTRASVGTPTEIEREQFQNAIKQSGGR